MAFTQDQLTALEAAIATGTLEIRVGDKLIRYQTTVDMIKARDLLRDQLNAQNPAIKGDNFYTLIPVLDAATFASITHTGSTAQELLAEQQKALGLS